MLNPTCPGPGARSTCSLAPEPVVVGDSVYGAGTIVVKGHVVVLHKHLKPQSIGIQ